MANLKDLHSSDKAISTNAIFKTDNTTAISLQILAGEKLKEHITKTNAFLVCINGEAVYGEKNGKKESLTPGDYVFIPANEPHWVEAKNDSLCILVK